MEPEVSADRAYYSEDDVIDYLINTIGIRHSRARIYLDPRNYIIGLLFYKYNNTEMEIEGRTNIDRSTVNHAKKQPYDMLHIKDPGFARNTEDVRTLFPFDFPEPITHLRQSRYVKVRQIPMSLDEELYLKIKNLAKLRKTPATTVCKSLIKNALELVYNMREEHRANVHYQSGYFKGVSKAEIIESTNYRSLENAIIIKQELLTDFKQHFKWDMSNKDYAECTGMLDALNDRLIKRNKSNNEQRPDSNGST
jgi:hypothetical protein